MPQKIQPMRDIIAKTMVENLTDTASLEDCLTTADEAISKMDRLGDQFQEFAYSIGGVDWLAVDPKELWQEFLLICENGGPFNTSPTAGCYDMEQEPCPLCTGECGRS